MPSQLLSPAGSYETIAENPTTSVADSTATAELLSPEVGKSDFEGEGGTEDQVEYGDSVICIASAASMDVEDHPGSQQSSILPVHSRSDPKFSVKELEEIYLARRSRELTTAVGTHEEELGRHLTSCLRVIKVLNGLHAEIYVVRNRQAIISNGASLNRAFEYERDMQQKITIFYSETTLSNSRLHHQPTPSSLSRKLRTLGHSFYLHPSLLSSSFNRLWNSLWSRA